jgi:hypothetical protein
MAVFALVHGAWHGGWCWEKLVPELERLGHRAVAVDLPCEDADLGALDYARVVVDALADVDDDVVAVGHSLAGLTIPLVAAQRPVARLVFLAAILPVPGAVWFDVAPLAEINWPEFIAGLRELPDGRLARPEDPSLFYHDCDPADTARAVARLRPQGAGPMREPSPLERWPDVERSYILCRDDRVIRPEWARRAAHEQLGVEAVELPGSHSPFLSRPAELARVLAGL